jgi:FkbM family methyltransferase
MVTRITHNVYGLQFALHPDKPFQDVQVIEEVFGKDVYHIQDLVSIIKEPRLILDIGGHIGSFGMLAAKTWPDARIVAVEPVVSNVDLYRSNAALNGFQDRVTVINAAISYSDEVMLTNSPRTTGGGFIRSLDQAAFDLMDARVNTTKLLPVKAITVEQLIAMLGGPDQIDFCKWDCEGGECEAFDNMAAESAAKFRFMGGEHHIGKKYGRQRILQAPLFKQKLWWRSVRKKFPHLHFDYDEGPMGIFQAWPKELSA